MPNCFRCYHLLCGNKLSSSVSHGKLTRLPKINTGQEPDAMSWNLVPALYYAN